MENKIVIPNFEFKVGQKVKRGVDLLYISDIVFSITDFKWLVIAMVIDENDIIQKTVTIPYDVW
jgi:hypothetical protein